MTKHGGARSTFQRPIVIGVTGDIACGKSTVMRMLGELGAELIDADAVYHELITPGQPLWQALRDRFGDQILAEDQTIDRRILGTLVFADPGALADLDRLTHPAVIDTIQRRIERSQASTVAVAAVKLIESGMTPACTAVWLVTCDRAQQLARLMSRNGLSREEAERRVGAQPPLASKLPHVDEVIDNGGALGDTRKKVVEVWTQLQNRRTPR